MTLKRHIHHLLGIALAAIALCQLPSAAHARNNHGTVRTNTYTYEGGLAGGDFNGYGVCRYKNGNTYYGYWQNNYKEGLGRMEYADGTIDFGYWSKGKIKTAGRKFKPGKKVYGIDVSRHQKTIAWHDLALWADRNGKVTGKKNGKFRQPVLFAFMKSTEGASLQDVTFKRNFEAAAECGIIRGAYHFLSVSSSVDEQVKNYIRHTPLQKGDFPPILDLEIDRKVMARSHARIIKMAKEWLKKIEAHYGVRPVIYTYDIYYRDYLKGHGFDKYDFWIARYNPAGPSARHWEIWQFTDKGRCAGISTNVDIDIFRGTYSELREYVRKKGIKK